MSESEGNRTPPAEREALSKLEAGVGRLLAEVGHLRSRLRRTEARVRDLEALLMRFTKGDTDPAELRDTIVRLEGENQELKARIRDGREQVERLLSRVRFLEGRD